MSDQKDIKDKIGTGFHIKYDLNANEFSYGHVMRYSRCSERFCRSTFNMEEYKKLWQEYGKFKPKK